MAHHPPPPPPLPPPPQNFLDPSAYLPWSLFPNDWLSPLGYLGLFYLSDRKDLHVIFLYVNQVVNRKISEFIARKLDFFTFNIPLTIVTALRSFENQTMIIKRNGKQTVLQNKLSSEETLYIFSHCLKPLVCVGYIYFSCSLCSVKKQKYHNFSSIIF